MSLAAKLLASGSGWSVSDFVCTSGPSDPCSLLAAAQALREEDCGDEQDFQEMALRLAAAVCATLNEERSASRRPPTPRDERRVAAALRRIESQQAAGLSLDALAAEAAVSPCHFLRIFEQVVGVTPGQYMLSMRLRRAAVRLRRSSDAIATVALDCGFDDLSTFNRQFRRATGVAPGAYRAQRVRWS